MARRNTFGDYLTLFAAPTDLYNIDIQIVSRVRKAKTVSDVSRRDMSQISPEIMQILANGKRRFCSFEECYVIHLKNQGVKL